MIVARCGMYVWPHRTCALGFLVSEIKAVDHQLSFEKYLVKRNQVTHENTLRTLPLNRIIKYNRWNDFYVISDSSYIEQLLLREFELELRIS